MARKLSVKQEIARDLRAPRWLVSRPEPKDLAPDMSHNEFAERVLTRQHIVGLTQSAGPSKLPAKFIPPEPVSIWSTRKERDQRALDRMLGRIR